MTAINRMLAVGLITAAGVAAVTGGARAAAPRTVTTSVNVSFADSYFTDLCGLDVRFFNVGTERSTLFFDDAGAIVREIDTTQGDKVGWSSPSTGRAIVFPNSATLATDYLVPPGPGSPVTVTGTGLSGKVPGIPADAGIAAFAGHVAFINPDGVPIVTFDHMITTSGHASDPALFESAVCAALAS